MRAGGLALSMALLGLLAAATGAAAAVTGAPGPTGAPALDRFFERLHSLSASFTEVVTDAQGRETQRATGMLLVLRPGRFRWEIRPKGEGSGQLLVADGRNLWYYDRDLDQVTVRPEAAALTATPAMLLSGGPNALAAFDVSAAGTRDGLDWVRVVPKAADADFRQALIGFSGNRLQRMTLEDKLGETAEFDFQHAERNAAVSASEVMFTPPAGTDVIGTPER